MTRLMLYSVQRIVRTSSPVTKYVPLLLFLVCLASLKRLLLVLNVYISSLLATPTRVREGYAVACVMAQRHTVLDYR